MTEAKAVREVGYLAEDQRRWMRDRDHTSPEGLELMRVFRSELSEAEQIRSRLAMRTEPRSKVFEHYSTALEALGTVSVALGVAAMLPPDAFGRGLKQNDKMEVGERDFEHEHAAFLSAAPSSAVIKRVHHSVASRRVGLRQAQTAERERELGASRP